MLYIICGPDVQTAQQKLKALIEGLKIRREKSEIFKIESEDFSLKEIDEFISGQGLFDRKYIVVMRYVFKTLDPLSGFWERLEDIKNSENVFIIFENEIDEKLFKKLSNYAYKIQKHPFKQKTFLKKDFDIFSIADALGKRNKAILWVNFIKAIQRGSTGEEVCGILMWQIKTMLSVGISKDAKEAQIKIFPYNKAKNYRKNYKDYELKGYLKELVKIYHDSRRGIVDFEIALEKFVLSI